MFFISCQNDSETEKYQQRTGNVVDVSGYIRSIFIEDVIISHASAPMVVGNFLIVCDFRSIDEQLHIFDKNEFEYLQSICPMGQGPDEITNLLFVTANEKSQLLYVTDAGKQKIFCYALDSVLVNESYSPEIKASINMDIFPLEYQYINDTLCIGTAMEPTGSSGYNMHMVRWNMLSNEIKVMPYTHSGIKEKRVSFAVSMDDSVFVECYHHQDLMSIFNWEGKRVINVYGGRKWNSGKENSLRYYGDVCFCGDKIIALYSSGEDRYYEDNAGRMRTTKPTKFLVFNKEGDYLYTWETGYQIVKFCYDKDNHRIIMVLDDEMQFAYLDLEEIVG